jgi:hypothetical protein
LPKKTWLDMSSRSRSTSDSSMINESFITRPLTLHESGQMIIILLVINVGNG